MPEHLVMHQLSEMLDTMALLLEPQAYQAPLARARNASSLFIFQGWPRPV